MSLGLSQPLTEMNTRNISWADKGGRFLGLKTLTTFMCTLSRNSGSLKILQAVMACRGQYTDCFNIYSHYIPQNFQILRNPIFILFTASRFVAYVLSVEYNPLFFHTSSLKKNCFILFSSLVKCSSVVAISEAFRPRYFLHFAFPQERQYQQQTVSTVTSTFEETFHVLH